MRHRGEAQLQSMPLQSMLLLASVLQSMLLLASVLQSSYTQHARFDIYLHPNLKPLNRTLRKPIAIAVAIDMAITNSHSRSHRHGYNHKHKHTQSPNPTPTHPPYPHRQLHRQLSRSPQSPEIDLSVLMSVILAIRVRGDSGSAARHLHTDGGRGLAANGSVAAKGNNHF